jgi:hypothetical protein
VIKYKDERMKEKIRMKVGGVKYKKMEVYEEFDSKINGFMKINDRDEEMLIKKYVVE